jgi:hypothetical protein
VLLLPTAQTVCNRICWKRAYAIKHQLTSATKSELTYGTDYQGLLCAVFFGGTNHLCSDGYLCKRGIWPRSKLPLIVARRGDDGRYADRDGHYPQPPAYMQQRADCDQRESGPGSNVAADHSL